MARGILIVSVFHTFCVFDYYPVISRAEYTADKTGSIMSKYYDSHAHMVAGIVQNEKIPGSELDELERLIQRLRGKKNSKA